LTNTTFSSNCAETGDGSSIYLHPGNEFVVIVSAFSGSHAKSRGCVYVESTKVNLSNSTFSDNTASQLCSLVFVHSGSATLDFTDSSPRLSPNLTVSYVISLGTFPVWGGLFENVRTAGYGGIPFSRYEPCSLFSRYDIFLQIAHCYLF
jgi:hypothetical protein